MLIGRQRFALGRSGERHPLAPILNELKLSHGNVWVHLGQSGEKEERQFMEALLDIEPNHLGPEFRRRLFERTGGHPLFTVALLDTMRAQHHLRQDDHGFWSEGTGLSWEVLPARVEAVIEERIDRLNGEEREILTVASVEGEIFSAQVAALVTGLPERSVMRQLSQNLNRRHRLVRAQEETYAGQRWISRYRFDHVLFQDYLYHELSQSERKLLHGKVAGALAELLEGRETEMAVAMAHHYMQAEDYAQALHYSTIAADRATQLHESEDALTHYNRAIQLAKLLSIEAPETAALYKGRGRAYKRLGNFDQANEDLAYHLIVARQTTDQKLIWQAHIELGKLWSSRNYDRTRDYFEAALNLARESNEPELMAGSLNWIGNWHANDENFRQATICHQEALRIFAASADQQALAHTLDLLGITNLLGGNLDQCITYYDQAVALFREQGNQARLASSLIGRATTMSVMVYLASAPTLNAPQASADFNEALKVADEIGAISEKIWAHWTYALYFIVQGEYGQALKMAQAGVGLAADIQHGEWVVATQFALGMLYAELCAYELAREQLETVLELALQLRSPQWVYLASGALAGAQLLVEDFAATQRCLEAVVSRQTSMDTLGKRYCWVRRAELALGQGDPETALEIIERLIGSAPGPRQGAVVTYLWQLKAEALVARGHLENVETLMHAAINQARLSGERFLLWRLYASLGRYYHASAQPRAATEAICQAEKLIVALATNIPDEQLKQTFMKGARNRLAIMGAL